MTTPDPAPTFFSARDGVRLAYREVGEGRPLVLLHGFAGDATLWTRSGQADALAARGFRVVLPDFRGHGSSARPQEAEAYPLDVLADDGLALVEELGLAPAAYDLGGYSLGGRIVVRMLARGARPGRAVVGGQGMREMLGVGGGVGALVRRVVAAPGSFAPGSTEERTERWLRASGADPVALVHTLDSLAVTAAEDIARIDVPTLVVVGREDERAASAAELADRLPHGTPAVVPGDHGSAAAAPELVAALADFLADGSHA